MLNQQTMEKLYTLKLFGMADALKEQLQQPDINRLPFEERFGLIVDRHWTWKEVRKALDMALNKEEVLEKLLVKGRNSQFPYSS